MRAPRLRTLPLIALALAAGLAACSDGSSPTEPTPAVTASAATSAAVAAPSEETVARGPRASRQEAIGAEAPLRTPAAASAARASASPAGPVLAVPEAAMGGNGKGKGGGAGNRPAKPETPAKPAKPAKPDTPAKPPMPGGTLRVDIQPDVWNTNWRRSNGMVTAFIRGGGLADIDLDSIVLIGTDGAAEELEPLRAHRVGNHIRAFFAKDDAFATLDTPAPGETHEIVIAFTVEGEGDAPDVEKELKDTIRVVGPALAP